MHIITEQLLEKYKEAVDKKPTGKKIKMKCYQILNEPKR